jgi:tetratricopeptide (TPR) repeat protein
MHRSHLPVEPAELLRARYILRHGRPTDAIDAIASSPGWERSARAQALLARAREAAGDTAGARHAAERAIRIDPTLAEAHFAIAELATRSWWDWETARREYVEAIRLEPSRSEFHHSYGYLRSILGEHREAILEIEQALDLDPVSPIVNGDVAWSYYYARDYAGAVRQARTTLDLVPEFTPAMHCLMLSHEQLGQLDLAREIAARLALSLGAPAELTMAIRSDAPTSALASFWRLYVDKVRASDQDDPPPFQLAYGYGFGGELDSAFVYLDRAVRSRGQEVPSIGVDPRFDSLRKDSRFARYLDELRLPHGVVNRGRGQSTP